MKKNELKVLKALNKHFDTDKATLCPNQYHRFDAYNDNYIIEIKYRYKTPHCTERIAKNTELSAYSKVLIHWIIHTLDS